MNWIESAIAKAIQGAVRPAGVPWVSMQREQQAQYEKNQAESASIESEMQRYDWDVCPWPDCDDEPRSGIENM